MRLTRALSAAAVPFLAAPVVAVAVAAPAAADPPQTVVVMLRSPGVPAQPATAHGMADPQRAAALHPDQGRREQVVSALAGLGLRVTKVSRWSVQATAPRSVVSAVFGSARAVRPHLRRAAALPRVPAALSGLVTGVFGGDETRPAAFPRGTGQPPYDGTDLRTAYSAQQATVPTSTPGPSAPTIATVQLSGWRPADLTTYARSMGFPYNPVTSGQVVARGVDGADPTSVTDATGAAEVALDQQALLATAPGAKQRIYVAKSNTPQGFADAIYAVGDDASDNTHDGYHITALSISWGSCEDALDSASDPYYQTLQQALAYVVATGVTVFAASGDDGAYDCYNQPGATAPASPAVDYPASSPYVVAVGGTSLTHDASTDTWSETGWSGSGGGESRLWRRPAWQPASGARTSGRRVPDISVDGDPATGFYAYSAYLGGSGWQRVGGTSLGAPVAAGLLTQTLAAHGYTYGLGEIHRALYTASAASFRDVTTGSNGGDSGAGPIGSGWSASAGYDEVTGLGSPLWETLQPQLQGDPAVRLSAQYANATGHPVAVRVNTPPWVSYASMTEAPNPTGDPCTSTTALQSTFTPTKVGWNELDVTGKDSGGGCHVGSTAMLVDTKRPVVSRVVARLLRPTGNALIFGWIGTDPSASSTDPTLASGLRDYAYRIRRSGLSTPVVNWTWTTATQRTLTTGIVAGATYLLDVRSRDRALNSSLTTSIRVTVPIDDRVFGFSHNTGWHRTTDTRAYAGTWATSGVRGATASVAPVARKYTLWVTLSPSGGKAAVYVNGRLVKTIDTYAPSLRPRVPVTVYASTTPARRTVSVRVLGQRNSHSRGTNVTVDAIVPAI
jgi:hypothetical protein